MPAEILNIKDLRGPGIYKKHPTVLYDLDGTLFESYPGFIGLLRYKLGKKDFFPELGQAWDVGEFGQMYRWSLEQGVPKEVIDEIYSDFWTDPFTYKFAPMSCGAREFVEWNSLNSKCQIAHTSRPKSVELVSRESLERHFPEIITLLIRDNMIERADSNQFKINNAERLRAIFVDDQPSLGVIFADHIDRLRKNRQEPRSHLVILPYAQIQVPDRLLEPKYTPYITVFKNIQGITQDLERVKRFFSGRPSGRLLAN